MIPLGAKDQVRAAQLLSAGNKGEEASTAGHWLDVWARRSPIAQIDQFLAFGRWGAILAIGVMSRLEGFQGGTLVPPMAVLLAVIAYNLPVTFYVWQQRPLASGRVRWLLFSDLVQSTLAVVLTGGYHSFYFILFLLLMTEISLSFSWRAALTLVVSADAVQVAAMISYRIQPKEPFAAYMTVGKFLVSLIVGGLAILFSELVRREDMARQETAHIAERLANLNAAFVHLGESGLNLERTLATILRSTRTLPDVAGSLVLLPDPKGELWRIAASNTDRHPVGELVAGLGEDDADHLFFSAGAVSSRPLPPFVAQDEIEQLTGTYLRAPDGTTIGALVVGWQTSRAPSNDEQAFLQSLALAAGLALRNARLYAQEQEHVARLQHFETLQSTFFAAIGHELKTPLSVLKMLIPSLHQFPELPAGTRVEITETIEHNLERLETLVTDMLESARLEAGAIALHIRTIDLRQLIRRVMENLSPLLARKNQQAALQIAPDLPRVWADSRRVEQILSNLLGNAAKFAPSDSTIEMQATGIKDAVQICVTDAGPGVPLSERERIFDRFYIAVENKALAGAGLGLFICRELVRLHGGRIWVENRPGGGSRFCFTLPLPVKETTHAKSNQENPGHRR